MSLDTKLSKRINFVNHANVWVYWHGKSICYHEECVKAKTKSLLIAFGKLTYSVLTLVKNTCELYK